MDPENGITPKITKKSPFTYIKVRMPHRRQRPSICSETEDDLVSTSVYMSGTSSYDPSHKVQTLITGVKDSKYRAKHLFVEMDVLTQRGDDFEWREWARWVKYEEKVEDGGKRWSKPHVASLNMHYLLALRKQIMESVLLLDVECNSISQVIEQFLDGWIAKTTLEAVLRQHVRALCLKQHRSRHQKGRPEGKKKENTFNASSGDLIKNFSKSYSSGMMSVTSAISLNSVIESENSVRNLESMAEDTNIKENVRFLRKIPKGSEVANVMVGEIEDLSTTLCGFIRLSEARVIGQLTEVNLPTRFVFYLLGPKGSLLGNQEIGRCLSTMFVDEVFREVAYKARDRNDIIAGLDEFMEQVTVLPPGEWDPEIRIDPPEKSADQEFRKISSQDYHDNCEKNKTEENLCDPDLVFSGRVFGGLVKDIRGKLKYYVSDFRDALHIQCFASLVYIFLATLTPNVTFGGLLGQETDQYMGVMECILAAAVSGILFALLGGQPLNLLGSTGPMLILEKIIYQFCKDNNFDFLPLRFFIGVWTSVFLIIIVSFDLSVLVRYITRFTEESFASLVALIFMYEAVVKITDIARVGAPLRLHPDDRPEMPYCYCSYTQPTGWNITLSSPALANMSFSVMNKSECLTVSHMINSTVDGALVWTCKPLYYVPDAFLFSCILFASTFLIAIFLTEFRNSACFPSSVRQILCDFSVLIAILSMVGIDALLGLPTPKLIVPTEFKPTKSDTRGWVVDPLGGSNPWWLSLAACLPAILATILIFLDQQITSVIINRKENKLVKGKGYHLDLLVVAILVVVHSLLGIPWYVASTVSAIAHINSLKKQSECTVPEQRATALLVGVMSGAAVFITNILKFIPMPVLYGVFFYMGWSALKEMQFTNRFFLMFMPIKHQPDLIYLRHVPLWRVHIFTFVQIVCLASLWVVKSIKSISIVFPLLVLLLGVVRKILECMYTQNELKYLDDLFPPRTKNDKNKATEKHVNKITDCRSDEDFNSQPVNKTSVPLYIDRNSADNSPEGYKASFYIDDVDLSSPPTYENKGFVTKL